MALNKNSIWKRFNTFPIFVGFTVTVISFVVPLIGGGSEFNHLAVDQVHSSFDGVMMCVLQIYSISNLTIIRSRGNKMSTWGDSYCDS